MTPAHFVTSRRVEFCETDLAGIVHFANYYRYMEQSEHEYYRSLGMSIAQTFPDGTIVGWPRVSSQCSYQTPAHYEDVLEIRIRVARLGLKSLTMDYEFLRSTTRIATGRMKTVCCRFAHGEPMASIEIPAEYIEKFHAAAPDVFVEADVRQENNSPE
jgi:YbgC/YbaW family acyl-CoA thioester hydrolase